MRNYFLVVAFCFSMAAQAQDVIRVGAKHFNEGYILGEMIALVLEDGGYQVERKFNLGGTTVSFEALRNGDIDIYPEYTGTIEKEILRSDRSLSLSEIRALVSEYNLEVSEPYGFNNSYALVISKALQQEHDLSSISDLSSMPELRVGLSYEFVERKDGWRELSGVYNLPQEITSLEHGLTYKAIEENVIDVTDAYSTDGEINHYGLVLLNDDRNFFPAYHAVSFHSAKLPSRAKELLQRLTGILSESEMRRLNTMALFENKSHREIAQNFLSNKRIINLPKTKSDSNLTLILERTWTHLVLTLIALVASIIVAVPVGIIIYRYQRFASLILYTTGILQTIPSIALLALMIPLFGIGTLPAIMALFIYALLPILRNTVIGLTTVDPFLKKVASAIGLNRWDALRRIEIPLAMPMIVAGIRTAAVINVGTATLAAFIGAGGLGEFIVTGLALNNTKMILMGAIPAALMAVLTELTFELVESVTIPTHLRKRL